MNPRSDMIVLPDKMKDYLLESSQDLICIAGMDGYFKYLNPAWEKILGYSLDELLSRHFLDFIHPDDHLKNNREVEKLSKGQLTYDYENRYICKDGSVRFIQWKATPVPDEKLMYCIGRDVTRSRIAEKELSRIFAMSLDMICIADIESSTFLKVNPAFTKILGHPEKELLEKSYLDFIHPDDIESTLAVIENKLRSGDIIINFENRYRCKDGSYRWLSWVSQPVLDQGVTYAVARDITEKKLGEEDLAKSKAILEATNRMARVGGWELELATRKVIWTQMTGNIHDLPEGVYPSLKEAINFYHKDDRAMVANYVQEAIERGISYEFEARLVTHKGRLRWVRAIGEPTMVDGKCIRLSGTFQDITDHKLAEIELLEKETQYRNLADSGLALIWTSGTDKLCNYFNQPWLTFTGRSLEQEMGNGWAEGVHPDDFDRCLEIYTTAFDKHEHFDMDYRLRHASGEYRWIRDLGSPNYDSKGEFIGYIGHCFDVTEQKNARDALKKNLAEKETLLRELYHRTKNTLQIIHSMLIMQAEQTPDNTGVQKLVQDMENRIMAIALVQQKLYQSQDLSRINLVEYLRELAELIMESYSSESQHITLVLEGDHHIPTLIDTVIPCGLIVNELLTNTLKYAFPDQNEGQISISISRKDSGKILIIYSDTGIGVPEGFDFRGQTSLGFQTIFAIAEHQMRGKVKYTNEPGLSCSIEFPDTLYVKRV